MADDTLPPVMSENPMENPAEILPSDFTPVAEPLPPSVPAETPPPVPSLTVEPLPPPGLSSFAEHLSPPEETAASHRGEHILAVSNLHKKFGRKEVVKGVNFSMQNGEVAGLLGPNGAGKTTIFYMIVGFYKPTVGNVTLNDVDITGKPMYRRAQEVIAYLPQ